MMQKSLLFFSSTVLLLAGCTPPQDNSYIEINCLNSGGVYSEVGCTCPDETYDFNGEQVPLYSLDEEGSCVDPMGVPGGLLGEEAKKDQVLHMENSSFDRGVRGIYLDEKMIRGEINEEIDGLVGSIFAPKNGPRDLFYFTILRSDSKDTTRIYSFDFESRELNELYSEAYERELFPMALDGDQLIIFHAPTDFSGGMCMNYFQTIEHGDMGRLALDLNNPTELVAYELPAEIEAEGNAEMESCVEFISQ